MEETKKCTYCGEEILADAKKCKHCGEWLDEDTSNEITSEESGISKDVTSSNVKIRSPKTNIPWKTILKVVGSIIVMALVFMRKNAYNIGKVARFASYEMREKKQVYKIMSVAGKYQYQEEYTEKINDEDNIISKFTVKYEGIDEFKEDGTDTDEGTLNLIFEVEDDDGYSNVITLSYFFSYIGTWEQEGQSLTLVGEEFNMAFLYSATKYNRSDDNYYIQLLKEMVEDEMIPDMKVESLEKREQKIKSLTRERMITVEDGEEIVFTRID